MKGAGDVGFDLARAVATPCPEVRLDLGDRSRIAEYPLELAEWRSTQPSLERVQGCGGAF